MKIQQTSSVQMIEYIDRCVQHTTAVITKFSLLTRLKTVKGR